MNKVKCLAAAVLAAMLGGLAHAQSSAIATVSATVVSQITIESAENTALRFGTFSLVDKASGGTLAMDSSGVIVADNAALLGDDGARTSAVFTVRGPPGGSYSIVLPSVITLLGGAGTMEVGSLAYAPASGNGHETLPDGGEGTLYVYGTLHFSGGQPAGAYSGTFAVTVQYY